jgi:hypothetical protein
MQDYYTGFGRADAAVEFTGVALIFIFDARVFMQPGRRRGIAAQMQHKTRRRRAHPLSARNLSIAALSATVYKWNIM